VDGRHVRAGSGSDEGSEDVTTLAESLPLPLSFQIWGYHLSGEYNDLATMCEDRTPMTYFRQMWDHDAAWLRTHLVAYGGEPYHSAPEWWALWWVGEHIRRGHAPYPERSPS
jgi:hypothetical protein